MDKAPALTNTTIGELEQGGIGYAIDKALEEAMQDCVRRPGLEAARTVTITVKLKPKSNNLDEGQPGLKNVGVQASVKLVLAIIAQNPGITDAHLLRRLGRRYRAHALALHTSTLVMRRQIRAVRDGPNLRYWPVTS